MSEPAPELEPDDHPVRKRRTTELALVPANPPQMIPEPPSGTILHPPAPIEPGQRRSLLGQIWAEIALIGRMYTDPRYRVSRTAQFAVPILFICFGVNYFLFNAWFPVIPFLSAVAERLVCIILAITIYKVMTKELSRYRDVLDYLTRYGTI